MNKQIKNTALLLFMVIALPALTFAIFEFSAKTETEKMLWSVYTNQLDGILFSVNQYSDDYMSSTAQKIQTLIIADSSSNKSSKVNSFFSGVQYDFVQAVFLTDSSLSTVSPFYNKTNSDSLKPLLTEVLANEKIRFGRLLSYKTVDYQKIESIPLNKAGDLHLFAFVIASSASTHQFALIIIDSRTFTRKILAPKLRQVAGEDFIVAIYENSSPEMKSIIYSNDRVNPEELKISKKLWLFPELFVGMKLRGETLESIISQRTLIDLGLVSLLLLSILVGGFIIYRSYKQQLELIQQKTEFVSNVSHELRTPLALIAMYAETLELGRVRTEEKKQQYYTTISKESQRLSRIVNKILNFSRLEAGKRIYHFEQQNLNSIVSDVLNTYSLQFEQHGFTVTQELDEGIPSITADKEAVEEMIINLVDNGMKYSSEDKTITLRTYLEEKCVVLAVCDRGIGIEHKDQSFIFDKFFRVSSGDIHNIKGAGLGLALVYQMMKKHLGEIKLESKPGKGSTFFLRFPIQSPLPLNEVKDKK